MSTQEVTKLDQKERQLEKANEALERIGETDVRIYTDGSADGGTRNGGAGVVIYQEDEEVERWAVPVGVRCSSYQAELLALSEAAEWLGWRETYNSVTLITDSEAACRALEGEGSEAGWEP